MPKSGDWNSDVRQGVSLVRGLLQGAGTVGTTAAPLSTTATDVKWVIVQADDDNTGDIYVGSSTVANSGGNRGLRLGPGRTVTIPVDQLSDIYLIGSAASQTYEYLAGTE